MDMSFKVIIKKFKIWMRLFPSIRWLIGRSVHPWVHFSQPFVEGFSGNLVETFISILSFSSYSFLISQVCVLEQTSKESAVALMYYCHQQLGMNNWYVLSFKLLRSVWYNKQVKNLLTFLCTTDPNSLERTIAIFCLSNLSDLCGRTNNSRIRCQSDALLPPTA